MPACWRSCRLTKYALFLPVVVLMHIAGSSCLAQDVSGDAALARVRELNEQAGELSKAGKHPQAEALYKRAIALAETTLGPDHPEVAMLLIKLASLQMEQKRYGEAEPLCLRALPILENVLGAGHPSVAKFLNDVVARLRVKQGKYAEAEPLYVRALAIREKALGPNHPDVAASLSKLGELYVKQGRYAEANPPYVRALAIRERMLGPDHPDVGRSLNDLALLHMHQAKYAEAEPLLVRALAILKKTAGPEHPDMAIMLSSFAELCKAQGKYAEAEPLYLRALAIQGTTLGPDHPDVAISVNNLAGLYMHQAKYAEAEPLYLRALAIREKALGPDHPDVAMSAENLAGLYYEQVRYADAEALLVRALLVKEKALGFNHPSVAMSYGNLATLYKAQGKYLAAQAPYLRALAIKEKALGPEHPGVATSLNDLAMLYVSLGRYAEGETIHLRALAIKEKALGPEHPDVAMSLNNLALLYMAQGKYAEAGPLLKRTFTIRKKALGPEHPDVATSLSNLAALCTKQGMHGKAEPLYVRALAIKERTLGAEHPDMARALNSLAGLYDDLGKYAKAEPLYVRALAIKEKALGPEHPDVALSLNNLALLYTHQGKWAEAEPLYVRALAIFGKARGTEHPDVATMFSSLAMVTLEQGDLDACWRYADRGRGILLRSRGRAGRSALARSSFFGERGASDLVPCLALKLGKEKDVLELLEQGRALGLREILAEARARTDAALPPEDRERVAAALGRINALNAMIEKAAQKGLPGDALREDLRRAERDYDSVVAQIGEHTGGLAAAEPGKAITSKEAAQSLALDETTAIVGWTQERDWTWGYVITRSGVEWVDMSEVGDPRSTGALVKGIIGSARSRNTAQLSPKDLAELYRRRFEPFEKHLAGVRKLIVISHGWSALLPVEILLTEEPPEGVRDCADWPWLGARYEVSYAPSVTTLDILCRKAAEEKRDEWERPLLALADPPFSEEQLARMTSDEDEGDLSEFALVADGGDDSLSRLVRYDAGAVPPRIPGTRLEAEMIAGLDGMGGALLLVGPEASERRLFEASVSEALSRCRYVHLATHGYADGERPELSCLVLARAPRDEEYDGRLDMREVFHLKLDADLVVLSACRSGLGKHLGGEGMVGLSTAFFFAGTPAVVMSLWRVSDVSTALLMRRFYENLADDRSKSSALAEAKAWLRHLRRSDLEKLRRESPELAGVTRGLGAPQRVDKGALSDDKPFAHPYYWAPFILTGDPR